MSNLNKVSGSDIEKFGKDLKLVRSTSGAIRLRVTRESGTIEEMETGWFNFYIESWRTVVEAFFGEDTGQRVPAVMLLANRKLQQETYDIRDPFDNDWKVCAIFGVGRPGGGIGGDAFGKGMLEVHDIVDDESKQRMEGSFWFQYIDAEGYLVKVEADNFWAEFKY